MAKKKEKKTYYSFTYNFDFGEGKSYEYTINVDKKTLLSDYKRLDPPPEWTKLEFKQCEGCKLTDHEYCPIALRLVEPLGTFHNLISHDRATIKVITDERTYEKETDVQDGVRSMFGLIMATSECPSMKPFQPMARFHLPFSSIDETVYRVTSMYLLEQFIAHQDQKNMPCSIDELQSLYEIIHKVNNGITERMLAVAEKDSTLNAITILDSLASIVPIMVDKKLNTLKDLFD